MDIAGPRRLTVAETGAEPTSSSNRPEPTPGGPEVKHSTIIGIAALGAVAVAAAPTKAQTAPPLATKAGAPATIPPGHVDNGPPPPRQHKAKAGGHNKAASPAASQTDPNSAQ